MNIPAGTGEHSFAEDQSYNHDQPHQNDNTFLFLCYSSTNSSRISNYIALYNSSNFHFTSEETETLCPSYKLTFQHFLHCRTSTHIEIFCGNFSLINLTPCSKVLLEKLIANQEIHRLLRNMKVHYSVHKTPPLVSMPSQMNPVHTFPPNFPTSHSNIILPSTTRSSEWSLPFRFSNQSTVCISHLSHACYMPLPSHNP
jgi:hypothetical protein